MFLKVGSVGEEVTKARARYLVYMCPWISVSAAGEKISILAIVHTAAYTVPGETRYLQAPRRAQQWCWMYLGCLCSLFFLD